jgi:hypothetical protein
MRDGAVNRRKSNSEGVEARVDGVVAAGMKRRVRGVEVEVRGGGGGEGGGEKRSSRRTLWGGVSVIWGFMGVDAHRLVSGRSNIIGVALSIAALDGWDIVLAVVMRCHSSKFRFPVLYSIRQLCPIFVFLPHIFRIQGSDLQV